MKLFFINFILFLFLLTDAKAQNNNYLLLIDTVNNIQYRINKYDKVEIRKIGESDYREYKIQSLLSTALIYTKHGTFDTIKFSEIKSILLRPIGAYAKTFAVFAGISILINTGMMLSESKNWGEHGSTGPFFYMAFAPVTVLLLPAIAAGIVYSGAYPKEEVEFSGKYKWKLFYRRY